MKKLTSTNWLLIILSILLLSSCGRAESTQLVSDYTEFQVLSVKELYPQAEKAALDWQEDAYLSRVSLNVFPKTEMLSSSAYFVFRSRAFSDIYFSYDYKGNGNMKIGQSEGDFPTPRPLDLEINPETLPFDSDEAFRIMYDQLGKEIITGCSREAWPKLLGLEHRIPGLDEPTWGISFSCDSPQNWGAIIISAETGEVLEIRK